MDLRKKDLRLWPRLVLVRIVSSVVLRRVNVPSGSIKGKKRSNDRFHQGSVPRLLSSGFCSTVTSVR
jgi:hypothetical protein